MRSEIAIQCFEIAGGSRISAATTNAEHARKRATMVSPCGQPRLGSLRGGALSLSPRRDK
jgi:hypothetical protein